MVNVRDKLMSYDKDVQRMAYAFLSQMKHGKSQSMYVGSLADIIQGAYVKICETKPERWQELEQQGVSWTTILCNHLRWELYRQFTRRKRQIITEWDCERWVPALRHESFCNPPAKSISLAPLVGLFDFPERDVAIVLARFGFFNASSTLTYLGKTLGVTRERVRQLESRTIHRLRDKVHAMTKPKINPPMEFVAIDESGGRTVETNLTVEMAHFLLGRIAERDNLTVQLHAGLWGPSDASLAYEGDGRLLGVKAYVRMQQFNCGGA